MGLFRTQSILQFSVYALLKKSFFAHKKKKMDAWTAYGRDIGLDYRKSQIFQRDIISCTVFADTRGNPLFLVALAGACPPFLQRASAPSHGVLNKSVINWHVQGFGSAKPRHRWISRGTCGADRQLEQTVQPGHAREETNRRERMWAAGRGGGQLDHRIFFLRGEFKMWTDEPSPLPNSNIHAPQL